MAGLCAGKTHVSEQLTVQWESGNSKIDARIHKRILQSLDALETAAATEDMKLPGFTFRALKGHGQTRRTFHV